MALSRPNPEALFAHKKVRAQCLATDVVGKCAYAHGPRVGDEYVVRTADPGLGTKMPAIGVIIAKIDATHCWLQLAGENEDLMAGMILNRAVFVGSDGALSQTLPPAPAFVQFMGTPLAPDTVWLAPNFLMTKRAL